MPMQVFTVGQVLAAADVNEYLVNTRFAIKPADTPRALTTTLTNDPDLTLTADANKSYLFELFLQYNAAVAGNLKLSFTGPAGIQLYGGGYGNAAGGSFTSLIYDAQAGLTFTTEVLHLAGLGGLDLSAQIRGILVTSGTGGAVTLTWSQDTSNATNTILRQGSAMFLRRVS